MFGQGHFDRMDIATASVFKPLGPANVFRQRQFRIFFEIRFNLELVCVGKLESVRTEQFDAIVIIGIVTRRYHDPQIGTHGAGEQRHRRCRQRTDLDHIHADACETCHQCIFHHIAGQPGIFPDNDAMPMIPALKMATRRLSHFHGDLRRHRMGIGQAAYAVSTEKFFCHIQLHP